MIIHVLQSVVFSIINCHFVITKLIKEKPLQNIVITPKKNSDYSQRSKWVIDSTISCNDFIFKSYITRSAKLYCQQDVIQTHI